MCSFYPLLIDSNTYLIDTDNTQHTERKMSDNNSTDNENQPRGIEAVKIHMLENKIETALWISRVLSIVFAIGYLLPIFGYVTLI
jgi:hypothetical protein